MEIAQLKYFVQVAKLGSLSHAAETLCISQPALSKSIAKLEEELGTPLFDRVGRRLYLNNRGRYFLRGAEKTLQDLAETAATVRSVGEELDGTLTVGVFGPQTEALDCTARYMQLNPRVHVTFDARQKAANPHMTREFDMVFYPRDDSFADISGVAYARRRLMVCVPESHPLAAAGEADLAQFADEPFIFMNTTAGVYEQTFQLCVRSGFVPRVRAVTSSGAAQIKFIQDGLGVGLVDSSRVNAGRRGTALVSLKGDALEQVQCFACRPVHMLTTVGSDFLEFAVDFFGVSHDHAVACFARN